MAYGVPMGPKDLSVGHGVPMAWGGTYGGTYGVACGDMVGYLWGMEDLWHGGGTSVGMGVGMWCGVVVGGGVGMEAW